MAESAEEWLMESLRRLAAFLPQLEDPDFDFGRWEASRRLESGVYTMPYYVCSPAAEQLAIVRRASVLTRSHRR